MQYGFIIDQTACIGCHACTVACKTEHEVPLGVNRTWVKYIEQGSWPDTTRSFSVMRCNHCSDAPCVTICPTGALFKREDGIVDFDTSLCIGCKSCMQACPYDAIYIDPDDHTAQKCNYCVHRVEVGLEPACVVVCPEGAIISGLVDDPSTPISRMLAAEPLLQRSPEQNTRPNLWYRGGTEASIDPLGAVDPGDGGLWRDPAPGFLSVDLTPDSRRRPGLGAAAGLDRPAPDKPARVVYDTDHPMPWGWRVSSYFLTKGISAGLVIVLAIALAAGGDSTASFARWGAPLIAGFFLALTGGLLVADLKRPERFFYILSKGNPGSWLVRGAWILSAYGLVLAVWLLCGLFFPHLTVPLVWTAAVLGLGVAGYTAFLFGQAEGRDLWQSRLLLWHMLAGALAVGGGSALVSTGLLGMGMGSTAERVFGLTMMLGAGSLGLITALELRLGHQTANARAGLFHLTRGAWAREWWLGGHLLGVLVPVVAGGVFLLRGADASWVAMIGGVVGMVGLWLADDAFVRAGQSPPLS